MDDVYFLFLCAKNLYNDEFVHVFTFSKLNALLLENNRHVHAEQN